ncbi:MAG: hypothetical protein IJ221_06020, partial [Oscillibacter sp.]|nr:hypothetical protein [Oscillibacter sp.]
GAGIAGGRMGAAAEGSPILGDFLRIFPDSKGEQGRFSDFLLTCRKKSSKMSSAVLDHTGWEREQDGSCSSHISPNF